MRLHPHNIAQKTEVMVEHFQPSPRHKIGGRAKAMVVTGSRLEAVRYKQSFDRYIQEKGYPIKTLVAFSGTVEDDKLPGRPTPSGDERQGIREKELPEKFATRSTRCCWWRRSTRPASTSRCCTRCTWTSGWRASRRCRRSRG
jgi:type I restriction enzyme, R subunit